jgi:hypothetical protein
LHNIHAGGYDQLEQFYAFLDREPAGDKLLGADLERQGVSLADPPSQFLDDFMGQGRLEGETGFWLIIRDEVCRPP